MRTTLIIDDHVVQEAKRRAAERGITLSTLTTQALRDALHKARQPAGTRFSMPVYGSESLRDTPPSRLAGFRDAGR